MDRLRIMEDFQILSVSPPFTSPQARGRFVDVLVLANAMGLMDGVKMDSLDSELFSRVVDRLARVGIGSDLGAAWASGGGGSPKRGEYAQALGTLYEALRESPVPEKEWRSLSQLFELDQLADLLAISAASLRRYRSGERKTPDGVAERLHLLAELSGDLSGAYNEYGVRRWFRRSRTPLKGRTPAQVLRRGRPEDIEMLRRLARAARSGGAW